MGYEVTFPFVNVNTTTLKLHGSIVEIAPISFLNRSPNDPSSLHVIPIADIFAETGFSLYVSMSN